MKRAYEAFARILKKEGKYLAVMLLALYVIFQIVFRKQDFVVVFRTALSFFWVFILPGYMLMLYWNDKIGVLERMVFGSLLSAALISLLSYYLGLVGIDVKIHYIIVPPLLILGGWATLLLKKE